MNGFTKEQTKLTGTPEFSKWHATTGYGWFAFQLNGVKSDDTWALHAYWYPTEEEAVEAYEKATDLLNATPEGEEAYLRLEEMLEATGYAKD